MSGLRNIHLGDNRFFNNIFVKQVNGTERIEEEMAQFYGLHGYRIAGYKIISDGNIFYNGAKPYNNETNSIETPKRNPSFEIEEKGRNAYLKMELDNSIFEVNTSIVTTEKLGSTVVSEAIYENPDGSSYTLEIDFQGNIRNNKNPLPGPIEKIEKGSGIHEVW